MPVQPAENKPRGRLSGKIVLGIIGLFALIIFLFENSWLPKSREVTFSVCLPDPQQLRQGAPVILQSARVGTVKAVSIPGHNGCPGEAQVAVTTGAANIPGDSTVSIEKDAFLGVNDVVIHPGTTSAPRIGNGESLPIRR